jgi:hypothetical protein
MEQQPLLDKELVGSVCVNPPSDRNKPLDDDRLISREELADLCATLPAQSVKPVLLEHDVNKQVGVVTAMYQTPETGNTIAKFKLFDNDNGRAAQQLIDSGKMRGLSLGTDWQRQPNSTTRKVKLRELSVCTEGYRADTGIFNASKESAVAQSFVPLPPVNLKQMDPSTTAPTSCAAPPPVQQQQPVQQMAPPPGSWQQPQAPPAPAMPPGLSWQPQPQYGSMNASNYSQPQQPHQQQYGPIYPYSMMQSPNVNPANAQQTTMGNLAQNPGQFFKHQQQGPENLQQNSFAPFPYYGPQGFQVPQAQMVYPHGYPQQAPPYYPTLPQYAQPTGVPPPPAAAAPAPTAAVPAKEEKQLPPGLQQHMRKKRTAARVQQEDEESEAPASGDEKEETTAAEVKKTSAVEPAAKKQETSVATVPIPQNNAQLDAVIQNIVATQGMSNKDKENNIKVIVEQHKIVQQLLDEKRQLVVEKINAAEAHLKAIGMEKNATLERLRDEAKDPNKFKQVVEEVNSVLNMFNHVSGHRIADTMDVASTAAPASNLQGILSDWRSLQGSSHPAQHVPQQGSFNASKTSSSSTPEFPLPRHEGNPHNLLVDNKPYAPLFNRPSVTGPLPTILNDKLGTIKF